MKQKLKKQEWQATLEAWRASGKSAKAWCREQNLVYTTFLGWSHRLSKKSKQRNTLSFIELKDCPQPSAGITLEYEDVLIKITSDFDQMTLARCLQALRGNVC